MSIDFKEFFEYRDGSLYWIAHPTAKYLIGRKAGGSNGNGYLALRILQKSYYVHRVIYEMHHGAVPELIDHADGDFRNNRIENLRPATKAENAYNSKIPATNRSGIKGVSREKRYGNWRVTVKIDGKQKHIGVFPTLDLAKAAYEQFTQSAHGEFFRKK
jgi:hypothetical protein